MGEVAGAGRVVEKQHLAEREAISTRERRETLRSTVSKEHASLRGGRAAEHREEEISHG